MKTNDDRAPGASSVVNVHGYNLDAAQPIRREPPRPVSMRDEKYESRFDGETLFFDAIYDEAKSLVRIICPKLLNLFSSVSAGRFIAGPDRTTCDFSLRDLDRQTQVLIRVPHGATSLEFSSDIGIYSLSLTYADTTFLKGERVVLTVQKDNRLHWVQDWARFYRDIHGATAFCIYDNASTQYDAGALREAILGACPGTKVVIVHWPFKFGPVGVGKKQYWDSDFCKLGAMEHARWAHLQTARSVLNCDIDELVLSKNGKSVFEQAESSRSGIVSFFGDWIVGVDGMTNIEQDAEELRFADFSIALKRRAQRKFVFLRRYPMRCAPKWALVPDRCPKRAQWHVHKVAGWLVSRLIDRSLGFRHFREISTSWKYARTGRPAFDAEVHREDADLVAAFRRLRWLGPT